MPSAATIFALAEALDVDARWLATGEDWKLARPGYGGADWLVLPRYDLHDFTGSEKPVPVEDVPLRRDWLAAITRATSGMWLADMPTDALPEVAREGETVVWQDVVPPLVEGRSYAFLLGGRPMVRRLHIRPEGLVLTAGDPSIDPITLAPDDANELAPLGRALGAITLRPV